MLQVIQPRDRRELVGKRQRLSRGQLDFCVQVTQHYCRLWALVRDRSGGAIIWFGLTLPIILGMTGLGVAVTLWYRPA